MGLTKYSAGNIYGEDVMGLVHGFDELPPVSRNGATEPAAKYGIYQYVAFIECRKGVAFRKGSGGDVFG